MSGYRLGEYSSVNVLFLTLLDFETLEEQGIYTDLLREFVKDGHMVYAVSPIERKHKKATKIICEGNSKILKLRIGNVQKTNIIEKGISTLLLDQAFLNGIKRYFCNVKFDLLLYSTPPITFGNTVQFVKGRDGAKTYLLLKDIFPQNAVDLGMLQKTGAKSILYRIFRNKEKHLYRISDFIGSMSEANAKYITSNNPDIDPLKVEVCPNSIEPLSIDKCDTSKIKTRVKYSLPLDKTVFLYGGNLGKPQGVSFIIDCVKLNEKNTGSYFLIVGSGTEYNRMKAFIDEEKPKNTQLLNNLPKKDYDVLVNACDVGLVFLDKRFTIPNYPSRMLSYMQASLPVLAATDNSTDIKDALEKGKFGYWCESRDSMKFNEYVNKMCDKGLVSKFGENARQYLESNFTAEHSYKIIMKHFI